MSVEILREAAKVLRDPDRCNRPVYEDALADWLDEDFAHQFGPSEHALTLARLVLGGAS